MKIVGGLDKVQLHSNNDFDLDVDREAVEPAVDVDHVETILK